MDGTAGGLGSIGLKKQIFVKYAFVGDFYTIIGNVLKNDTPGKYMKKRIALFTIGLFLSSAVLGTEHYPERPMTMLVPFGVGGDADLFAKNLSRHAQKYLNNQTIVLENRVGASGSLAAAAVSKAPADGYTLLIGRPGPNVILPALDLKTPYRWNDFTVLGILELDPMICAVKSDSPYKNIRELMAAIRKQPGVIKYGAAGAGAANNLAVQYLLSLSGLKADAALALHFPGNPEINQAVMDGKVQFFCGVAAGLLPQIKSGAMRGLFTTAAGRLPELPQLHNATEVGLRDMGKMMAWTAVMGPPGLPKEVVARWKDGLSDLAKDPAWIKETERLGGQPALLAIKDPTQFLQDQFTLYERIITMLGLQK